ncbi:MAG: major facilitator superfamily 1 [Pseudonocardia sp.]|jgi:EmrB/QacA subfamily drug resistance transporter|uniref:MFS transporter n=1 Tax=Pseudonocardia sp. TaxID=60912 RepID=UPI00262ABE61|nr:MFS transporter [Pseudonocardia sp.]MCU1628506.1 major facilitator superfamily 1 [Pseudonocardia sp.]
MTTGPTGGAHGGLHRGLALLVAGAFFMEILDGTVIAPAAPHIAEDLGIAPVAVNVAITAYVLTLAVLIPISGWLTDRFGARLVFTSAVGVFTLASLGCALAVNLPMLVGTRVLQGVGGAMMVPVGRLVVLRTTAKADLVRAIAYLTWPALVAPVLAPALGGVLSTYASWRWIFVLNIPLGLGALVLSRRLVPDVRGDAPAGLDRRGFALTAVGVAALVVGLENVGAAVPDPAVVAFSLVIAATSLGAAVVYLLRTPRPLLNLRILRVATFRVTALGGSVFRAVITAIPFLLPLFLQLGFGWNAAEAGLVVIALFVGNVGIKPATTPLMRLFGIRTVMLGAVLASAACLVGIAFVQVTTPLPLLLGLLLLSGIFRSVGFTAYNSVAFSDVDQPRMNSANTLMSTLQELGAGLGVAVGALLVRVGEGLTDGSADRPFRVAFVLLAVLLLVPAIEGLLLARTAGDEVTGRA